MLVTRNQLRCCACQKVSRRATGLCCSSWVRVAVGVELLSRSSHMRRITEFVEAVRILCGDSPEKLAPIQKKGG